jgi:hypothetical protein
VVDCAAGHHYRMAADRIPAWTAARIAVDHR